MGNRERLMGLVLIAALLVVGRLGRQTYLWYAHQDERGEIETLSTELEDAGMEVVLTQLAADSLHRLISGLDEGLADTRRHVDSYGGRAIGGMLPPGVYDAYRSELDAYNQRVGERNVLYGRWRDVIDRNHAAVDRFNRLADSIRGFAATMGEPYYPIPTPAEIATAAGIEPPAGR